MRYGEPAPRIEHFFYFTGRTPGRIFDLVAGERDTVREALFSMTATRSFVYTLAHFTSADLKLPSFRIAARDFSFRERTSAEIGFRDVPDFTTRYEVHGEDETAVRALLNDRVRAALAGMGSLLIEGKPSELLCVSDEDYSILSERDEFFGRARVILSRFRGSG